MLMATNMNLERWEGGMDPPNLKSILFQRCTNIPNDIGYILHEDQISITKLQFDECSFVNTNSMKEIVAFATELAHLPSITSFCFTSCSLFDHVQKMCLVQCLREERDVLPFGHSVCRSNCYFVLACGGGALQCDSVACTLASDISLCHLLT
jgi:hypothetical protein